MVNSTSSRISAARNHLFEFGPEFERETGDFARVALPKVDAEFLVSIVENSGARSSVEIGLAYGVSALAIAEGMERISSEFEHVVVDPFQHLFGETGWKLLNGLGLKTNVKLIREKSQFALPTLLKSEFVPDFAFVDGSHIFHNVFLDFFFLDQLVAREGLVVVDDIQHSPVAKAAKYFVTNRGWVEVVLDKSETRLSAFRMPEKVVSSSFEQFIDF